MLRDMTIGQFYPAESVIHRLDPRVKVVGVLAYLISLFLFRGFVGYAVVTVFLGTVIVLSKVPLRYIVRGMKLMNLPTQWRQGVITAEKAVQR